MPTRSSMGNLLIIQHFRRRRRHRCPLLATLSVVITGPPRARVPVILIAVARPCCRKRDGRDPAFGRPGHDGGNDFDELAVGDRGAIDADAVIYGQIVDYSTFSV